MPQLNKTLKWLVLGLSFIVGGAVLLAAFVIVLLWSQSSTMDDYIATVESAATRLPIAVEFEKLFPGETDHFITHYGFNRYGGERTNTWNSEAYFAGRYSLTMRLEVVVDYKNNTITRASEPTFYLVEYYRVDDNGGGVYSGRSDGGKTFGEKEWRSIYDSDGDFSIVSISIRKDSPVPILTSM